MRRNVAIATLALASALLASRAPARTWSIRADGSGDAPTIQAATDSTAYGDTILVAAGTYYEIVQIFYAKSLLLRSESGAASTIIDAQYLTPVVVARNTFIDGFTLRNGLVREAGGGVRIGGPEPAGIKNCIIENNTAGFSYDSGMAGGLLLDGDTAGVIVESNVIRRNVARYAAGGVLDGGSSNIIRDNLIMENRADVLGGGVYIWGTTLLLNNLIIANDGGYGGGGVFAPDAYGAEIRNNTIAGNRTYNGMQNGAGIWARGPIARISHNLVADNHNRGIGGLTGVGIIAHPETIVECNDTWNNDIDEIVGAPASSNFSADPEFCAVEPLTSLNFQLQRDSPCAPGNDPHGGSCGLVGAAPIGCGTVSVERRTWSDVKRLFR